MEPKSRLENLESKVSLFNKTARNWVLDRCGNTVRSRFSDCQIISSDFAFISAFQAKALMLTGGIDHDEGEHLKHSILSFLSKDGWIYDARVGPRGLRRLLTSVKTNLTCRKGFRPLDPLKLGETRQNVQALMYLDPEFDFRGVVSVELYCELQQKFLNCGKVFSFRDPWRDFAQVSHLAFLTRDSIPKQTSVDVVTSVAAKSNIYGTEFGERNARKHINGLMKIIMTFFSTGGELPIEIRGVADAVVESIDPNSIPNEGCDITNLLVIYAGFFNYLSIESKNKVVGYCVNVLLPKIEKRRKEDGGYSFFEGSCQTHFYGRRVSEARDVSDLHGTLMSLWGINLIHAMVVEDRNKLKSIVAI